MTTVFQILPYGVDWKKDKAEVEREAQRGFAGRFGAGTPRISDGQLLFLQHLVSKMKPVKDGGSRIGIVHNGSPLFTGDAGSGESEIRRWVLEKDLLETIIALPDQLFYNTGINTYLWFLTNRKSEERKGRVQLIDARTFFTKRRKSLGNKRNEIDLSARKRINDMYMAFEEGEYCKIFDTTNFGYRQITIERPLRLRFDITKEKVEEALVQLGISIENKIETIKETTKQKNASIGTVLETPTKNLQKKALQQLEVAQGFVDVLTGYVGKSYTNREKFVSDIQQSFAERIQGTLSAPLLKTIVDTFGVRDETADICTDAVGNPEPDSDLRDHENVPLGEDIKAYFEREVKPYVPDAWINESIRDHKDNEVGKVGYEIPFTRYFYKYEAPRELEVIEKDIECVENELLELLKKL
jgi:type I restriction enzyme M protein